MPLNMADGPVANLPPGMDAYGGYVNKSGIGITFPEVEAYAKTQNAIAFSITTDGEQAQCADVERGAMSNWMGYDWGYCAVSSVNGLIALYGRPPKLWTAHYDPKIGRHICSPKCWPGLVTTADGTQWTNHGGPWDESVLSDNFFDLAPIPVNIPKGEITNVEVITINGKEYLVSNIVAGGHLVQVRQDLDSIGEASNAQNTSIIDLTTQWPQELANVQAG